MPQFRSLAELVRNFESGSPQGNYQASDPRSTASGAYSFLDSTWQSYASKVPGATLYTRAKDAPPAVQDEVFNQAVATRGLSDWTCPGCNPQLASYINSNPDVVNLPVSTGGDTLTMAPEQPFGLTWTDPNQESTNYQPFYIPGTDNPLVDNSGSGQAVPQAQTAGGSTAADTSFWTTLWGDITNIMARAGLVLVGVMLLGIGAYAAVKGEVGAPIRRAVRRAA